jgi:lysophospholipase L1-like esterase
MRICVIVAVAALLSACSAASAFELTREDWDYVEPMKEVAATFTGTAGVVLHLGDSITYANPYGQWARYGKGKTAEDKAVLRWMHVNKRNKLDGWHLAAVDRPRGRSETAASGIGVDQYLKGGFRGLPSLAQIVKTYNPQIVVLMLGTNGVTRGRATEKYRADMDRAIRLLLKNGTVVILSTIPPHVGQPELGKKYNAAVRELAKEHGLPLIDYYAQILKRRPDDWDGTLLNKGDVHPSHRRLSAAEPTPENLKKSGYLLRGYLSVQKIKQVKERVIDAAGKGK